MCGEAYRQQAAAPRPEEGNPNPQHSVPQELIEQQASFVTKMMDTDGQEPDAAREKGAGADGGPAGAGGGAAEEAGAKPEPPANIRLYAQSSKFKFVLQQVRAGRRVSRSLARSPLCRQRAASRPGGRLARTHPSSMH